MSLLNKNVRKLEYTICGLSLVVLSLSFLINFILVQIFQNSSIFFYNIWGYLLWIAIFFLALKGFDKILFWLTILTLPWILHIDLQNLYGVTVGIDFSNVVFVSGLMAVLNLILIAFVIINFFIKRKIAKTAY